MGQTCCSEDPEHGTAKQVDARAAKAGEVAQMSAVAGDREERLLEAPETKARTQEQSKASTGYEPFSTPAVAQAQPGQRNSGKKEAKEFTVVLKKEFPDASLGIDVDLTDNETLIIDKINDGILKDWNRMNPGMQVKVDDRIVAVNGKRGDAIAMTDAVKRADVLTVVLQRDES